MSFIYSVDVYLRFLQLIMVIWLFKWFYHGSHHSQLWKLSPTNTHCICWISASIRWPYVSGTSMGVISGYQCFSDLAVHWNHLESTEKEADARIHFQRFLLNSLGCGLDIGIFFKFSRWFECIAKSMIHCLPPKQSFVIQNKVTGRMRNILT